MSDDPTLQWGVYDTVTKTFFSLSNEASAATFSPLIHLNDLTVQRNGYLYATVYSTKRPIAAIVATSYQRLITHFYNHLILRCPPVFWESCSAITLATYSTKLFVSQTQIATRPRKTSALPLLPANNRYQNRKMYRR